jgi:hypothetical protein
VAKCAALNPGIVVFGKKVVALILTHAAESWIIITIESGTGTGLGTMVSVRPGGDVGGQRDENRRSSNKCAKTA